MRRIKFVFMALFLILIICSGNGYAANSLRCQGGIISLGDTKADVTYKCGNPTNSEKSWLNIEYLIYDFGPNHFIQTIKIVDGKVNRIKGGSYGGWIVCHTSILSD